MVQVDIARLRAALPFLPDVRRLDGVLHFKATIIYFPMMRLMQQLLRLYSGTEEEKHQRYIRYWILFLFFFTTKRDLGLI